VFRAAAFYELIGGDEGLAADAVQGPHSRARRGHRRGARAPQALDAGSVAAVDARADEVVVRERQWIAQRREPLGLGVHELGHREPGGHGGLDVLQRVVVGATEDPDVVAAEPTVPSKPVRLDALEGEPDMRVTGRVDAEPMAEHVKGFTRPVEAYRLLRVHDAQEKPQTSSSASPALP
jgi:hypothetical protein